MKIGNCRYNAEVTSAVFRIPGCTVRATDFDELPGKGTAYSGLRTEGNHYNYRSRTGMRIVEDSKLQTLQKRFFFDILWDRFVLELQGGEFAVYTINDTTEDSSLSFVYSAEQPVSVAVLQDERALVTLTLESSGNKQTIAPVSLSSASTSKIKIRVNSGIMLLEKIIFH
ncbi:hypothetical protein D3C75_905220 [compost metagenome]